MKEQFVCRKCQGCGGRFAVILDLSPRQCPYCTYRPGDPNMKGSVTP